MTLPFLYLKKACCVLSSEMYRWKNAFRYFTHTIISYNNGLELVMFCENLIRLPNSSSCLVHSRIVMDLPNNESFMQLDNINAMNTYTTRRTDVVLIF